MKRIFPYLTIFVLFIMMIACSTEKISEVTIHDLINHSPKAVVTNEKEVNFILSAIDGAEKQPGVVDMAPAPYMLNVGEESYFLWIQSEPNSLGTIMNLKDTHTIYTLSSDTAKRMYELLSRYFEVEKESEKEL